MVMAITTKFISPTNHRGSRVKATVPAYGTDWPIGRKPVTLSWDSGKSVWANHVAAAEWLARRMDWHGLFIGNDTGDGYVFCRIFIDGADKAQIAREIIEANSGSGFYIPLVE